MPEYTLSYWDLPMLAEIDGETVIGTRKFSFFKNISIALAGIKERYDCVELPAGQESLIGLIYLEDLG